MTKLLLADDLLDAQLIRAVGATSHRGADLGEVLQAIKGLDEKDPESWYQAWNGLGERCFALGEEQERAGHRIGARDAFLRACTYLRTAGALFYSTPIDPRMIAGNTRQTEAFRRAAALLDTPAEVVQIPFEGTTLPGYFFKATDETDVRRATVIGLGGYDGTAEESYFYFAAPALARGYNVLIFDGPGQGAALLQQWLPMRADWDTVITPVVDFVVHRSDVDPERIALAGLSMGGFLGPRAASKEHRLAALIADSGSFDMYAGAVARMPKPLAKGFEAGHKTSRMALAAILEATAKKPTAGWSLRRGMAVHGVPSPLAYLDALKDYRLDGYAQTITCPTLVTHAEGDDIGASAPQLFEALTVPDKTLIRFTVAEGAGDHCEAAARTLFDTRAFAGSTTASTRRPSLTPGLARINRQDADRLDVTRHSVHKIVEFILAASGVPLTEVLQPNTVRNTIGRMVTSTAVTNDDSAAVRRPSRRSGRRRWRPCPTTAWPACRCRMWLAGSVSDPRRYTSISRASLRSTTTSTRSASG